MLSKEASSTIFWVFGMTRPGIEPRSPEPLANTLTARPMSVFFFFSYHYALPNSTSLKLSHGLIFQWLYFNLIYRHNSKRWVAVVPWQNHLILAVDLWCSSVQHLVKHSIDLSLLHFMSTMLFPMASKV